MHDSKHNIDIFIWTRKEQAEKARKNECRPNTKNGGSNKTKKPFSISRVPRKRLAIPAPFQVRLSGLA